MRHRRRLRRLTGSRLPPGFHIRPFEEADIPVLREIEARAGALFAEHGYPQVACAPSPPDQFVSLVAGNDTLVAAGADARPLGYAVAGEVGGIYWLKELGVDPDVMKKGIGTALIEATAETGRSAGFRQLGLSTFRNVPFNAPFYARRGFGILDSQSAPAAIREQVAREVPEGVKITDRVLMIREL